MSWAVTMNLKKPEQIPVIAKTDSKSLWDSVHNSKQCEEKMLRNTIAGIKELIDLKMLDSLDWVSTGDQLADSPRRELQTKQIGCFKYQ